MREATAMVERFAAESGRPVTIKGRKYELTAATRIERRGAHGIVANVSGKPAGYWVWQNTGTKPHTINPKPGTRRGRPNVIAPTGRGSSGWNHPQSVPVHHRGATGRHRWREVDRRARREVPQIFVDVAADTVRKVR